MKSYHGSLHLFSVLNDPDQDGKVLIVMLSSVKPGRAYDNTCVLEKNDHKFIKHQSYIVYAIAEIVFAKHIEDMITGWDPAHCKLDHQPNILQLIIDGIYDSENTDNEIYDYAKALGL